MIIAAADGSSLANPGPSGWAWYIDDAHWAAGGWPKGTNNMGELMSVLDLLRATKDVDEPLRILCDSQYAINCCTRWIPAWKKRGWRKADNKPVLNLELLQQLDQELHGRNVTFQWVKGHAGHPLNERADDLARAAATAYQQGTPVNSGPGFGKAPIQEIPLFETESLDDEQADSEPVIAAADTESEPAQPTIDPVVFPESIQPSPPEPLRPGQPDLLSVPYIVRKSEHVDPDQSLVVDITELTRELMSDEAQLDTERLDQLMHPDYVVHMPSGTIRTRGSIIARPAVLTGNVQLTVIGADLLDEDIVLLRYKMRQNSQDYLCAAIWQRHGLSWQVRFQQFTTVGP